MLGGNAVILSFIVSAGNEYIETQGEWPKTVPVVYHIDKWSKYPRGG